MKRPRPDIEKTIARLRAARTAVDDFISRLPEDVDRLALAEGLTSLVSDMLGADEPTNAETPEERVRAAQIAAAKQKARQQ